MKKQLRALFASCLVLLAAGTALSAESENFRARISSESARDYTLEDVTAEIEFGREIAAHVLGTFPLLKEEKITSYVEKVGTGVAMNGPRTELVYHFAVLDTEVINAFAAPGGYVFVTKGILDLMEDEAQLAALLAHEISHVTSRHIVKEMNVRGTDDNMITGLSQIIGASTRSARALFKELVDSSISILFDRGYKIEDEFEADRGSIILLAASGYDANALSRLLKAVYAKSGKDQQKSVGATHPPQGDRLAKIEEFKNASGLAGYTGKVGAERFAQNAK